MLTILVCGEHGWTRPSAAPAFAEVDDEDALTCSCAGRQLRRFVRGEIAAACAHAHTHGCKHDLSIHRHRVLCCWEWLRVSWSPSSHTGRGSRVPAAGGGAAPRTPMRGGAGPALSPAPPGVRDPPALSPAPAGCAVRSRQPPRGWMRGERRHRRRGRAGRAGLRRQPRALSGRPPAGLPAPRQGAPAKVRAGAGSALFS